MLNYANGDMQAFGQLYARYEQPVYRYIYNGCNNEPNAHELFQDVWLRVIKSRNSFKASQPFRAWIFTIARNLLIDHYRKKSTSALDNRSTRELDNDPDTLRLDSMSASQDIRASDTLTPEQIASAAQRSDTLSDALHRLPFVQREAVMLKHIAGLEISEIAQIQEQGAQAVKSRLRYAMVKLRQSLKELS